MGQLILSVDTIADFRKDNGEAIRLVCREFVMLCRKLNLFTDALVAVDGSKFKTVNTRDRNYSKAKMKRRLQQIEESIEHYLGQIESADRRESRTGSDKVDRLEEKIAALKKEMQRLKKLAVRMLEAPDQQISLTDPDVRSMATSGRGSGVVGYNVQAAVETKHHLIVAHEVSNVGNDRQQLYNMANQAHVSASDPDATLVSRPGVHKKLCYKAHFSADADSRMITDCHATTGARHECPILPERIAYQREDLELPIEEVIADRGYGRGPTYAPLREQKIRHYIPLHDPNTGRGKLTPRISSTSAERIAIAVLRATTSTLMRKSSGDRSDDTGLPAVIVGTAP